MFTALDKNGDTVWFDDASKTEEYFCGCCGNRVVFRKGTKKLPHFAHPKGTECVDRWNYEMSEWHKSWQEQFPLETREVVIENETGKHRADVLLEEVKTVIEFQNSPMNEKEFQERNRFYTACGYHVIWLFNLKEPYESGRLSRFYGNDHDFVWKNAKTVFDSFFPQKEKSLEVLFQMEDSLFSQEGACPVIEKISWRQDRWNDGFIKPSMHLNRFYTQKGLRLTPWGFVQYALHPEERPEAIVSRETEIQAKDLHSDSSNIAISSVNTNRNETKSPVPNNTYLPETGTYWFKCILIMESMNIDVGTVQRKVEVALADGIGWIYKPRHIRVNSLETEGIRTFRVELETFNDCSCSQGECIRILSKALMSRIPEIREIKDCAITGNSISELFSRMSDVIGAAFINIQYGTDVYVFASEVNRRGGIRGRFKKPRGQGYYYDYRDVYYAESPQWIVKFTTHRE